MHSIKGDQSAAARAPRRHSLFLRRGGALMVRGQRALQEFRIFDACRKSPQPSPYTAVIVFCNTSLRNAELRRARWSQVDFLKEEFWVGEAKTAGSQGRIIPLNQAALGAFREWRSHWPDAKPEGYIFPTERLMFKGAGSPEKFVMTAYDVGPGKPLGAWKRAWSTAKKQAGVECRIHDLRHHFISALAQTQTPDARIQAINGHLSRKMLEHYSHVRLEAKRRAVEALDTMGARPVQQSSVGTQNAKTASGSPQFPPHFQSRATIQFCK